MQEQNEINLNRAPAWRAFRAAAPQTLPVFAGYLVLGLGYGIYVQSLGLPVWLPPLMGTVVYGGSLEFVLASLLLGSFAPVSAFLMALMIQARHLFYGLTMLQRYRGYGLRSAYMIFAMSDETFSITCSAEPPEGVDKGWFMFFITLLDQIYAAVGAIDNRMALRTLRARYSETGSLTSLEMTVWSLQEETYSLNSWADVHVSVQRSGSGFTVTAQDQHRPLPMDSETVAAMLSVQRFVETVKAVDSADLWTSQKTGQPLYYQLTYHASEYEAAVAADIARRWSFCVSTAPPCSAGTPVMTRPSSFSSTCPPSARRRSAVLLRRSDSLSRSR